MRIASAIFAGSIAALAALTAPALAKDSNAPKTGDQSASPACTSYEQTLDGEWRPVPCQELGSSAQTQHKPATGSTDNATH